eukprot:PLAT15039.1.p1 GENE.PLAT15039.1~~PLAT15039.1.p1  ORF type:complete len:458 (+),score=250.68 PLAT15039.1:195-1376(+)
MWEWNSLLLLLLWKAESWTASTPLLHPYVAYAPRVLLVARGIHLLGLSPLLVRSTQVPTIPREIGGTLFLLAAPVVAVQCLLLAGSELQKLALLLTAVVVSLGTLTALMRGLWALLRGDKHDFKRPTKLPYKIMRAHGNSAEYAHPIIAAMLLLDTMTLTGWLATAVPLVTRAVTALRCLHALGLITSPNHDGISALRFTGALGSYFVVPLLAAVLAYAAWPLPLQRRLPMLCVAAHAALLSLLGFAVSLAYGGVGARFAKLAKEHKSAAVKQAVAALRGLPSSAPQSLVDEVYVGSSFDPTGTLYKRQLMHRSTAEYSAMLSMSVVMLLPLPALATQLYYITAAALIGRVIYTLGAMLSKDVSRPDLRGLAMLFIYPAVLGLGVTVLLHALA